MAALRPAVELFPKLEYLTWIGSGVLDCEHLPGFVSLTGSSLQVVEILAWPLHNDQKSILKTSLALLADRSPRVWKISIRFKTLSTLQLHSILPPTRPLMPSTWAHLQKFAYTRSPLDEHTFMCLAGLESLCALEIWLPDALSWTAKAMPPCSFMSLKSISLGTTVSSYITFSTLRALPDVDSVSLQLMGAAGTERRAQLAASVRLQFSTSTVRTISITYAGSPRRVPGEDYLVVEHHVRPFLDFKNLTHFSYVMPFEHSLGDDLFVDMAHAWPQLSSLSINCPNSAMKHVSLPSLHILPVFVTNCPHLSMLTLTAGADCQPCLSDAQEAIPAGAIMSRLDRLHFVASPISHPDHVAGYLAHVFPDLEFLSVSGLPQSEQGLRWQNAWDEVRRYLPWFKSVRADEHRWVVEDEGEGEGTMRRS